MHIKIDSALWSRQKAAWLVETNAPNSGAKSKMRPLIWSGAQAYPAFPSPESVGGRLLPLPLGTVSFLPCSMRHVAVSRFHRTKDFLYLKSLSFS